MDIRNVANNGGIENGSSRAKRADQKQAVLIPTPPPRDEAKISSTSRETAAAIENLAERVRNLPSERSEIVAAAIAKLKSGELDGEAALAGTAKQMLAAKFLSA